MLFASSRIFRLPSPKKSRPLFKVSGIFLIPLSLCSSSFSDEETVGWNRWCPVVRVVWRRLCGLFSRHRHAVQVPNFLLLSGIPLRERVSFFIRSSGELRPRVSNLGFILRFNRSRFLHHVAPSPSQNVHIVLPFSVCWTYFSYPISPLAFSLTQFPFRISDGSNSVYEIPPPPRSLPWLQQPERSNHETDGEREIRSSSQSDLLDDDSAFVGGGNEEYHMSRSYDERSLDFLSLSDTQSTMAPDDDDHNRSAFKRSSHARHSADQYLPMTGAPSATKVSVSLYGLSLSFFFSFKMGPLTVSDWTGR